jgi:hypothetical protein
VDLERNRAARRILMKLSRARVESAGSAVPLSSLIAAGWPGERIRPSAGASRVYTTIRTLRRCGLEAALVTRDDGYLVDPNVEVRFHSD